MWGGLRAKMACGFYYFMVNNILDGEGSLREKLLSGVDDTMRYYHGEITNYVELDHYGRLFYLDKFSRCKENKI